MHSDCCGPILAPSVSARRGGVDRGIARAGTASADRAQCLAHDGDVFERADALIGKEGNPCAAFAMRSV